MSDFIGTALEYLAERGLPILIGTAAFWVIRRLLVRRGVLAEGGRPHEIGTLVFALYVSAVLSLTYLPLLPMAEGGFTLDSTIWGILTGTYTAGSWVYTMLAANVVMFLPLGFLTNLLWRQRPWQTLALCLAATLCVELLQPLAGRSFDIDDILLNFLGGALGLLAAMGFGRLRPRAAEALKSKA